MWKRKRLWVALAVLAATAMGTSGCVLVHYHHLGTRVETVRYTSMDGTQIVGQLVLPRGAGPHPAVVQVGGSSREGRGNPSARIHATALAWNGVAVLFYDRRGVGESGGVYRYGDHRNTIMDIHAAFDFLRGHRAIDRDLLGYVGHSEGGLLLPQVVLERDDVRFAYGRVAPVLGFRHTSHYQRGIRLQKQGLSSAQVSEVLAFVDDVFSYFGKSVGDPAYHRGEAGDMLQRRLDALIARFGSAVQDEFGTQVGIVPYRDATVRRIAHYQSYDAREFLERGLGIPLLYVYASNDENVGTPASIEYLEGLRRRTGQRIDLITYEGQDHKMFKPIYLPIGGFPPGYLRQVSEWVTTQVKSNRAVNALRQQDG